MRVIVAGAGLAGLTAATRLVAAGHDVTVLEGRDETGGRSRSRPIDGDVIEFGGQHVSRRHQRMRSIIAAAGLHLQRDRFIPGPVNWRRPDDESGRLIPAVSPVDLTGLRRLMFGAASLRSLRQAVRSEDGRNKLDSCSIADWFDDLGLSGTMRHMADSFVSEGSAGADPRDTSMLQFADFLSREGSILRFALTGMGLNSHIVEGTGAACGYLASQLGGRIRLGAKVTNVEQDEHEVAVHVDGGDTIDGDHVVIAVPTPVLADIGFAPELPEELRKANAAVRYGQATKVAVVVGPRRPWQATAFVGGKIISAGWRTQRVLYGFIAAGLNDQDTTGAVDDLCHGFGINPQAVKRVELIRWADDPFTRGTYVYLQPGQFADFRHSLPQHHQRVHFAGAERSSWPTWMEGAVESGELAADALIAASG